LDHIHNMPELALRFDTAVLSYIVHHRSDWITDAMSAVSMLGDAGFLAGVVLLGGLYLRRRSGSWVPLLVLTAAGLGAAVFAGTMKDILSRSRPPAAWMTARASGSAFPSDHATRATAVYGALGYLVAGTRESRLQQLSIWTAAVFASLMIGVSRVYVGVHWPTDVIGGWTLAVAWLVILLGVYRHQIGRR
jgi:membrane-associated phospholipid phosphatase